MIFARIILRSRSYRGAIMITIKPKPWRFSLFASQAVVAGLLCANLTPVWASTQTFKPVETPNPQEQAPPWSARPDALLEAAAAETPTDDAEETTSTDATAAVETSEAPEPVETTQTPAPVNVANIAPASKPAPAAKGGNSAMETWYRNRRQQSAKPATAISEIQAAAEQGDRDAQFELGLIYQGGRGVPQDKEQAQQWLTQAAQKGHGRAQYALALLYREQGADISQSLKWQRQAAQSGYAEAQYGMGLLYANGQYLQQDKTQARFWFEQAAAQGHVASRLALLSQGGDVPTEAAVPAPTPTVAAIPAEPEPAEQPQATSVPEIAAAPKPVAPTPAVAPLAAVETPAAAPADTGGADSLDLTGVEPEVVKQSAEAGNKSAQLMLGTMYEDGLGGLPNDPREAAYWYEKAARQGYPKAQYNLGLLYEDGRGVKQDYKQAAHWYNKAAEAGFTEAQNNLGVLYVMGNGVKKDPKRAKQLFSNAASQGNANAERNLSMLKTG